jgi:hypothetical protein
MGAGRYGEKVQAALSGITTARALARCLAEAATEIRQRARALLAALPEGQLDGTGGEDVADLTAQSIAHGLLWAHFSHRTDSHAEHPGLRVVQETLEALPSFRQLKVDFEELGISALVEQLHGVDREAVCRDFAEKNGGEDLVLHFYELFLKEYNSRRRRQRGVFYTPRPVASFLVRSVDDLLRTEFGLADGMADTATWDEMVKRHAGLSVPAGARGGDPFVQILDPAAGTGAFLVEVIEVIHQTMTSRWRREGRSPSEQSEFWRAYVSGQLLPRLCGFEIMPVPFAVAQRKVILKLRETGYDIRPGESPRIYLSNTLAEPEGDSRGHGSQAATVVLGNPPYCGISGNNNAWINGLLKGRLSDGRQVPGYYELDGQPLGEKKHWLQDDYVKFLRYGQCRIEAAGAGVLGFITNHGYLDNPTFRGMRRQLLAAFPAITVIDLHGNTRKKERSAGQPPDQNVFDIGQGVAIGLFRRPPGPVPTSVQHADLWGTRAQKYDLFARRTVAAMGLITVYAITGRTVVSWKTGG